MTDRRGEFEIFVLFFNKKGVGGEKLGRNWSFASGPRGQDATHLETTVWGKLLGVNICPLSPLKIIGKNGAGFADARTPGYLVWFSPACTSGKRPSSSARSDRSRAAAANGRSGSG